MNNKTFKAQAIALVMVVLVVASIIGVSLFSRMAKEKQSSIDQQESSISLTQVDSILDFFVGADIEKIEEVMGANSGFLEADNLTDISKLLRIELELGDAVSIDDNWCTGDNYVNVTLEYSDSEDYVEYQPGSVAAYNLQGVDIADVDNPCTLKVRIKAMEPYGVFVVKRVYNDAGTVTEDVTNYCIQSGDATPCPSDIEDVEYTSSLSDLNTWDSDAGAHYIDIDLYSEVASNTEEIRILPIKGVLGINNELQQDSCIQDKQFNAIKITAEANCNDTYRGKQMFLPGSGTLGYSTLFDYGIYDSGLFQP
jgi:hypothetical protein